MASEKNLAMLNSVNRVDGFDPTEFAVDYTDLTTGETRKRLPVMIQMAWFRLKYPDGRIAVQVTRDQELFVACAKVYPHYNDPPEHFLAEATASRGWDAQKPSVSPREWAQTAAVGIALRNAGFGVQFNAAGDEFPTNAAEKLSTQNGVTEATVPFESVAPPDAVPAPVPVAVPELTPEQKYQKACSVPCPIAKYRGRSLGDLIGFDPGALKWLATKFKGDNEIIEAAKCICEYAVQTTA